MEDERDLLPDIIRVVVGSAEREGEPQSPGFLAYREGDIEPTHNKRIKYLVLKARSFIVYLDDEHYVYWATDSEYRTYAPDFNTIINRVGYLESIARGLLAVPQIETLAKILGDCVAVLLDDADSTNARDSLDKAENYLNARTMELGRTWYISSAAVVTAIALAGCAVLWLARDWVRGRIGLTAFVVLLGAGVGALGALIFIIMRIGKIGIDAMAGRFIHHFEGAIRIIAGMAGAALVTLAVKANVFLGALDSTEKSLPLILTIAMIAGASERIVPNLIKKVEGISEEPQPKKK